MTAVVGKPKTYIVVLAWLMAMTLVGVVWGRAIISDCGLMSSEYLDRALAGMQKHLGLKKIYAMIISHMHGDHFLLGEHLRKKYGTQIWTLDRIADICEHPERYDYAAMIQSYNSGVDSLTIDRRLRDGQVIEWEGYRLQMDWMPGQTEFGCCLWLELDGKRIAFTGDNIFGDPSDQNQDGHEAVVARNSAILEEGYLYAAKYLKQLRPDLLMGGHSFVMPEPNAFIDRYHQWAQDIIRIYQDLLPGSDYRYRFDPYWVKAEPYRATFEPGQSAEVQVVIRNFRDQEQQHHIKICTPSGVTAQPAVQTDPGGHFCRIVFPSVVPGAYKLSVKNDAGWSTKDIFVNRADPRWISEERAYPGLRLKLIGRNLDAWEYNGTRNTKVRMVTVEGEKIAVITPDAVNPYCVDFTVPPDLATGKYYVEVCTGCDQIFWQGYAARFRTFQ